MIIIFKPVEINDKETISKYLSTRNYMACDYGFIDIFAWQRKYNTSFAEIDGYLCMRACTENGDMRYLMPVGPEDPDGLRGVLIKLKEFSENEGKEFLLIGITDDMKEEIERAMPDTFDFTPHRDYSDYVYNAEDLIELKGKKLHGKRNHINKFISLYPDFKFEEITDENLKEVKDFSLYWCKLYGQCTEDEQNDDYCATKRILDNMDRIGAKGAFLRVDGKIIAYTIGMPLNSETYLMSVEKALHDMQGAYTMINREYAERYAGGYKYINREEDLGIEGLRTAKLSYYPAFLLTKHSGRVKNG